MSADSGLPQLWLTPRPGDNVWAMDKTPKTLERIGQALFGENWLFQLAKALKVNDRTLRHWMSERDPIPAGIWKDLARLCIDRMQLLETFANLLNDDKPAA